ncbi:DMT family transporter [Roseivirga seohaensis]|uniref:DMT family transporter n=1 Tax=Roseivirga seohaensis TaxID=1914963 RepID=UPI003BAC40B1
MDNKRDGAAYIAFFVVSIVWGTTYYALKVGVETFPPFLFSAIRQILAGGILLVILRIMGALKYDKNILFTQLILGTLMIALGNGVIGWSEQYIPSGLAALIVSILPFYVVVINYLSGIERLKPNKHLIKGLGLGAVGIALIFRDNLKDFANPNYFLGMLFAFGACLSWAAGSVYTKQKAKKGNVMTNVAFQMLFGGVILGIMSLFLDDYNELHKVNISSMWALGYLILIGSVITYPCYIYALENLPIGLVSTYTYINPFVALILGYFLLNERITTVTVIAFAFVMAAIYYIHKSNKAQNDILKLNRKKV